MTEATVYNLTPLAAGGGQRCVRPVPRCGLVIVAVLAVIVLLSLSAYSFSHWMRIEAEAAAAQWRASQARLLAQSGVELARALLYQQQQGLPTPDLYDNPHLFDGISLFSDQDEVDRRLRGRFSVVAPLRASLGVSSISGFRFGLVSENSKLDLNFWAATDPERLRTVLTTSLGVPAEVASGIVEWINGAGSQPAELAAVGWLARQEQQYRPKGGPLESIAELLQVRGVSPLMLFGDTAIDSGPSAAVQTLSYGAAVPLAESVTIYARSSQTDHLGRQRINLNEPDLPSLYRQLQSRFGPELARFVIAFRVLGPAEASTGELASGEQADGQQGPYRFQSVLDIVGGHVAGQWRGQTVSVDSPVRDDPESLRQMLPRLLEELTVATEPVRAGTIDVNRAGEAALDVLRPLAPSERDAILAHQAGAGSASATGTIGRQPGMAWLVTDGILTLDQLRAIQPYVTERSEVYRVRSFGYYPGSGPYVQVDAVLDATQRPVGLLFYQEQLGPPPSQVRRLLDVITSVRTLPDLSKQPITLPAGPFGGELW